MKEEVITTILLITFTAIPSLVAGSSIGYKSGRSDVQQEAIEQGHADWAVDSKGHVEFKWKEVRK